jgi:eukaryotic-like serine/threonine-protein kinase
MPPEQLRGESVTRAADIYAAGVMLWELVVHRRFYDGKNDPDFVRTVALGSTLTPTQALEAERERISPERWAQVYLLEPIINRAMASSPATRYGTAAQMAIALTEVARNAATAEVATWVRSAGIEYLDKRQRILLANEESFRVIGTDDGARSSGARVRVPAVTLDAIPDPCASEVSRSYRATVPTVAGFRSRRSRYLRTMLPWALCAALLVAVCILATIAIGREPVAAAPTTAIHLAEPRLPATTVAPPEPLPVAPPAASVVPSRAPAPAVRPPVRVPSVAPPRATPSRDCSPPYYFDGSRKIFKPSCF